MKNPLLLLTALLSLAATAQANDPCANLDALETREQMFAAFPPDVAGRPYTVENRELGMEGGVWTRYTQHGQISVGAAQHDIFKRALTAHCARAARARENAARDARVAARGAPAAPDPRPASPPPSATARRVNGDGIGGAITAMGTRLTAFIGGGATEGAPNAQPTPGTAAVSETERTSRCAQARIAVNNCDDGSISGPGGGSRFYCAEGRAAMKTYRCE